MRRSHDPAAHARYGRRSRRHGWLGCRARLRHEDATGTSQGLFRDFHVCTGDIPGTFRRISREGPDSTERRKRAGQGPSHQHSMMFNASAPRVVSLYLTDMSALVSFITLPALTYASALLSRWQARRRQHAFHCSSRRAPGQGRRGCCRRALGQRVADLDVGVSRMIEGAPVRVEVRAGNWS